MAHGKNIPKVKTPSKGPPITPKILSAASKTRPKFAATKTREKQMTPKTMARILETLVALTSSMLGRQKGRTKSSKQMAASEFNPLDTVLHNTVS